MYQFIYLIKALASCLVLNSHLDSVWPSSVFAAGGQPGNALFFAASGFLIYKIKDEKFVSWYIKKFLRIYPYVIIPAFLVIPLYSGILTPMQVVINHLCMRTFWFLKAILALYIPFYIIIRSNLKNKLHVAIGAVTVIYFICYFAFLDKSSNAAVESDPFRWIFYFITMLFGAEIRFKLDSGKLCPTAFKGLLFAAVGTVCFFGAKIMLVKLPQTLPLQFMIHMSLIPFVLGLFFLGIAVESKLKSIADKNFWQPVKALGNMTLEVFLLMDSVILFCVFRTELKFPVSLIFCFVVTWICAYAYHKLMKFIYKYSINKLTERL